MSVIANIIPLILVLFIFWLLLIRPQVKQISQGKDLTALIPESCRHTDIEAAYKTYRKTLASWIQWSAPAAIVVIVFLAGLLLFGWKITQTSDFALQFDRTAHAELGEWVIGLGFVLGIGMILGFPGMRAQKKYFPAKEMLQKNLKDALAFAENNNETREKIEIEEMLKKLSHQSQSALGESKNMV